MNETQRKNVFIFFSFLFIAVLPAAVLPCFPSSFASLLFHIPRLTPSRLLKPFSSDTFLPSFSTPAKGKKKKVRPHLHPHCRLHHPFSKLFLSSSSHRIFVFVTRSETPTWESTQRASHEETAPRPAASAIPLARTARQETRKRTRRTRTSAERVSTPPLTTS